MTTCKRFYRKCEEFAICVNIGKKDYVTVETPEERYTIFCQLIILYQYLNKLKLLNFWNCG